MNVLITRHKSIIYGIVLSVLYVVYDLMFRFDFSVEYIQKNELTLPVISTIQSSKYETQDIIALYSQFDKAEKAVDSKTSVKLAPLPVKILGIGAEQENKQNGPLSSLYFGENVVRLMGIFSSSEVYAVVAIQHLADKTKDMKKLSLGQKLFDYTVSEITAKSIGLARNKQKIELKLFKK